jgi:hypothetical protein
MIKEYVCEKLVHVSIYFLNYSNNCKTWSSVLSYIEYELITPFKFHLKSFTPVISQKHLNEVFHLNKHKCVAKNIVEKLMSFEK